jgi:DNA-binding transcriptional ArsR family regulator
VARTTGRGPAQPPEPARPALLRSLNDAAALRLLLEHGALSRVDMVRLTGISKPTASQLLARLEEAGLVRSVGRSTGGPGRSAVLFELDPSCGHAAALDVTPQRIHAQVAESPVVISEHKSVTSAHAGSGSATR